MSRCLQQSLGQVRDKVADCVADFHDLCPRQVHNFVANLSRTLSQSRRNGIWALKNLLQTTIQASWPTINNPGISVGLSLIV